MSFSFAMLSLLLLLIPFGTHGLQYHLRLKKIKSTDKFKDVIRKLNVSIHTHIAVVYFLYILLLLTCTFFHFSIPIMVLCQIFLTLMILNFLSFLLRPYSAVLSVLPMVTLSGHEAHLGDRRWSLRFRVSHQMILEQLTKYFYNLRIELYSGLIEHDDNRSILYFMRYKRHGQARIINKMKTLLMRYDPVLTSKALFLMVILLFFAVNYTLLYNGLHFGVLQFNKPLEGLLTPLYYLITTFSTVGYGDITPLFGNTQYYTLFLLLNTVLILLVIVNVIQDFSLNAIEKILSPFREFQSKLADETNRMVYLLEVGGMEEEAKVLQEKFRRYPELSLILESYLQRMYHQHRDGLSGGE